MYPTIPKYSRSSAQIPMSVHHHSNSSSAHKFSLPLPPPAYLPIGVGGNQQFAGQASPASPYGTISKRNASNSSGAGTEACRSYWSQPNAATIMYRNGRHYNKRKSAVELLAETKQFYIKSDVPLERLHQSNYRSTSNMLNGAKRGRNSVDDRDMDRRYNSSLYRNEMGISGGDSGDYKYGGYNSQLNQNGVNSNKVTHTHHHHHHGVHSGGRHTISPGSNFLKNKLKTTMQMDVSSMKDNSGNILSKSHCNDGHYKSDMACQYEEFRPKTSGFGSKEFSSISFEGEPKNSRSNLSYMSSGIYNSNYESGNIDEPLILTENYRAISPPAEYAADFNQSNVDQRSRYNYQRSYSHSQEVSAGNCDIFNINSHKSLPDLHSQISRHSPHSEILSCCSRGNRSIKSAGESSLNRDSGGSSGHYTHRSEPCYRQHEINDCDNGGVVFTGSGGGGGGGGVGGGYNTTTTKISCSNPQKEYRRDSGSSTQHSANSYGGYVYARAGECSECRCKMTNDYDTAELLLNFPTPEVPEAFQDDYVPPSTSTLKYKTEESRYSTSPCPPGMGSTIAQSTTVYSASMNHHSQQSHSSGSLMQSPGSAPSIDEISPPPIQFKRQKCIRFKNRSRISLPSAAVHSSGGALNDAIGYEGNGGGGGGGGVGGGIGIGGGGYHHSQQQAFVFPKCFSADGYRTHEKSQSLNEVSIVGMDGMSKSVFAEPVSELEKFFDRLGLNDDKFHEIYSSSKRRRSSSGGGSGGGGGAVGGAGGSGGGLIGSDSDNSSTVFFSDVSTVDSMRLPDSTETQPATETYRPSEPPSIVERNARIIKWLCNCRKVQNL